MASEKEEGEDEKKQWPNLWEESHDMMVIATAMFFLGKMRKLGRDGKLIDAATAEGIQTTPITSDDIVNAIEANREVVDELEGTADFGQKLKMPRVDLHAQMLHTSLRQSMAVSSPTWRLLEYNDEHAEDGLVYGIAVDDVRRRVIVPFRGTESAKDWSTNLNAKFCRNRNPLYDRDDEIVVDGKVIKQPKTLVMHRGFRDYMFGEENEQEEGNEQEKNEDDDDKDDDDNHKTKFDSILESVAKAIMEDDDRLDYDLYTTGFSLGGALTTVFALFAAASSDVRIPKPITCFSFASPKVGTLSFRKAFQSMELSGKLRCVRVANEHDPIKEYPETRMCLTTFCGCGCLCTRMYYRHVGMTLFLHQTVPGYSFSYYPPKSTPLRRCWDDTVYDRQICRACCTNGCKTLFGKEQASTYRKFHGYPEYLHRLERNREGLREKQLEDLYQESRTKPARCIPFPLFCAEPYPEDGELILQYY